MLAALLKFLVLRIDLDDESNVSHNFEFNMRELLEEVGRDGTRMTASEAEEIIERYVSISYHLRDAEPRPGLIRPRERTSGHYPLVVGYTTLAYEDEGDNLSTRFVERVNITFDLVEGLKRGEITFAGMRLGRRQPDKSIAGVPFMLTL